KKGRERGRKYEQPKGVGLEVYVPLAAWPRIDNQAEPLLITEGEKKAAAATQAGFACVGLTGVECWSKRRPKGADGKAIGRRELLPSLAALPLQGREVLIVFDGDAAEATVRNVRRAEQALAGALQREGAKVKLVRLPTKGEEKVGLD